MDQIDQDFKGANEIGKIFNSFLDKKLLCDFFLDSVLTFIKASDGYLYLLGNHNQLWLETATAGSKPSDDLKPQVDTVFHKGQPRHDSQCLMIPLIVRNNAIGVVCFFHQIKGSLFSDKEFALAMDLTYQMAGALQNILLFEQNLKMERLAAVGQTTSIVMHELMNILQLAKLADECLRRGFEGKNEKYIQRGLSGIQKAVREMDGFTYEMLSLTKDYKVKPVEIEIGKLIQELYVDLKEKSTQARVKLEIGTEGEDFKVEGEPRSLYRALLNMVKNAMEASNKEDAYIRVKARSIDQDTYEITVADNGQGMTEEVKARIFQAFFSTKGERGTGLGLMIIDRTVKAHQGVIRIESEAGKGTTFFLTFPKKLSPA